MYKNLIVSLVLISLPLSISFVSAGEATSVKSVKQYSIEDFIGSTGISGASFSADEKRILFSSNKTGVWNAYSMPVAGGEWTAVSSSTVDNVYAVSYFPDDDRVLVTRDQGGNELDHLYVIDKDGKEKDLTPGEKLKAQFYGFTYDGKAFDVVSNERDERYFDLYRYRSDSYQRELIFKNDEGYDIALVSDDAQLVVLTKFLATANDDMYLYDRKNAKLTHLTPHQGNEQHGAQYFSADKRYLWFTSNAGSEFAHLSRYDLKTGKQDVIEKPDWDVVSASESFSGRYRVTAINEDGNTKIKLTDNKTGKAVKLPQLPNGEIRGVVIARSEKSMAFYLNGDRQPNDLYVLEFGQQPRALTRSLNTAIDANDLVDSAVVRFKSFDGMTIPNILWKPQQATRDAKAPALVWVHGGPGGQTTRAHSAVIQFLANHGYVVLGINNRGSSGYGKTFFVADDGKHGREPLWDVVAAKKYLQSLDYVDREKIGIIGGSYGGYMTLAALAFQPEEFNVGVDIFGVSNWIRTLENFPAWWESYQKALFIEIGDPKKDREFLIETSPLFHADKIKKPLLVLQGANDPRVLKVESDEIVAAVKKNNVPVEYILFDDEGHGFSKKKNQITGYGAVLTFLDKYLKSPQAHN